MHPTTEDHAAGGSPPASGNPSVESIQAQFELGNKLCTILPAVAMDPSAPAGDALADGSPPPGEIVGSCMIEEVRYLVLCCDQAAPAGTSDPSHGVAELLTRRELQIAMLVAKGRVNKQIAGLLSVSEWTVSSHLRRIYAKLGVRTRAAMVARVVQEVCASDVTSATRDYGQSRA